MDEIKKQRDKRTGDIAQKNVERAEKQIDELFVWKDEFSDIMHKLYQTLRQQNYGLAKQQIRDALDVFCKEKPDDDDE